MGATTLRGAHLGAIDIITHRHLLLDYGERVVEPEMIEPVVIEPVVNREKLLHLLALQTEYPTLDYKASCDLRKQCPDRQRNQVELAKDVGAMSVRGGFIVGGVDGHGVPTGEMTPAHAAAFDEAQLRPVLLRWLPETLEIRTQSHEVHGQHVVVIYIAPNPAGCAFFRADGQYGQGKDSKTIFRQGEVFYREGTESRRLSQQGLEQVIAQRVQRERARWEAEHAAEFRRLAHELTTGGAGQQITRAPAAAFNLTLEVDVLTAAAIELLRAGDDIPLRLLLNDARTQARHLLAQGDVAALTGLVDRVTCLAATFLTLERPQWFERAIATLASIYDLPLEAVGIGRSYVPSPIAAFWLMVCERVLALGSLAVRLRNWPAVAVLAAHRIPISDTSQRTWIHHTGVMINRAELLKDQTEGAVFLLSRARAVVRQLTCLHPDLPGEDERILTSLTQFDFLACLVGCHLRAGYYPNFAPFETWRTRPVTELLLHEPSMRQVIFSGDDRRLAAALRQIDAEAQQAGWKYDGWAGYSDPVENFITTHLPM
ncbi:hypothetical protein, partial [Planomonospora parontospora]